MRRSVVSESLAVQAGADAERVETHLSARMDERARRQVWRAVDETLAAGPLSASGAPGATVLCLGYVQSGKTTAITGLIAAAADAGYRLVIAMLGSTNLLLDQNRARIEEALGLGSRRDYTWVRESNPRGAKAAANLRDYLERGRIVFVPVLKHAGRIAELAAVLESMGDVPTLIIDDEADQASLNTESKSASATYRAIKHLRSQTPRHLYTQFTATPYAPLLLDSSDMLHPDKVVFLTPGAGYTGGRQFFVDHADAVVRDVPMLEEQQSKTAPIELPNSLVVALASFFTGTAMLLRRDLSSSPVSMLIHSTARNDVQQRYEFLVRRQLKSWLNSLSTEDSLPSVMRDEAQRLEGLGVEPMPEVSLARGIEQCIRECELWLVNSTSALQSVDWTVSPVHILIGGNKLDRGFTVEGLTVTYLNRPSSPQVDTLEQRARAFGYRSELLPFCQFFASKRTVRGLREIVFTELDLRARLEEHVSSGGSTATWAREVGLLLPAGMAPTRSAVLDALTHVEHGWQVLRNPLLAADAIATNRELVEAFGLVDAPLVDFGRLQHRVMRMPMASAVDLLERWVAPDLGPGWNRNQAIATMKRLEDQYDSLPVVLLQAGQSPRVRKWDEQIGFINLFQGRDLDFGTSGGLTYPGDRAVPTDDIAAGAPVLQVHRVSRRGYVEDVLVPAVYLGQQKQVRKEVF